MKIEIPKTRTNTRPDIGDDHIRVSFNRFQCLRSIAYAAQIRDQERLPELLKELDSIEAREMVGLLTKTEDQQLEKTSVKNHATIGYNPSGNYYFSIKNRND